jgi:hypothetical protein
MNPLETGRLDVTWDRLLKVWWSFAWRWTVFAVLIGMVLGALGGFIAAVAVPGRGGLLGGILGQLAGIPASLIAMKMILQKKFQAFSIQLVSNTKVETPTH